jgi:hypothetical protein
MLKQRPKVYIHQDTGDVRVVNNRLQARRLPAEYLPAEFTENDKGKRVMRIHLNGATVDISENETPEAPQNGDTSTE